MLPEINDKTVDFRSIVELLRAFIPFSVVTTFPFIAFFGGGELVPATNDKTVDSRYIVNVLRLFIPFPVVNIFPFTAFFGLFERVGLVFETSYYHKIRTLLIIYLWILGFLRR